MNYDRYDLEKFVADFLDRHKPTITKWCALTGSPSSGKTTVIRELAARGFKTNPDISRQYLETQIKAGITKEDARRSEQDLQRILFLLMVKNAAELPVDELIFHDYSLPDNIAFLRMANLRVPEDVLKSSSLFRYWKVFLIEPLPFQTDHIRTEDAEYHIGLTAELDRVYAELGYEVVRVPVLDVTKRADFVVAQATEGISPTE